MIVAIDMGNTNAVIGCMEGEKLIFTSHISTDRSKTVDEYALLFKGIFEMNRIDPKTLDGGIISSVVPMLRPVLRDAVQVLTGKKPLLVGAGVKTGLNIKIDNPAQLGGDLVVAAVAACAKYPRPIVIFDMGTATTASVIDQNGSYLGGMIIPGLRVAVDALSARASQLPLNISLEAPEHLIGTNTIDCMRSGAIYGNAAMIDGIIDRVEDELGAPVTAVATGNLVSLVTPYCERRIHEEPNLLLRGLGLLYEKNCRKPSEPASRGVNP